jgi:hypothetical protein
MTESNGRLSSVTLVEAAAVSESYPDNENDDRCPQTFVAKVRHSAGMRGTLEEVGVRVNSVKSVQVARLRDRNVPLEPGKLIRSFQV